MGCQGSAIPEAHIAGGAPVVVRGREIRPHGEGAQLECLHGGLAADREVKTFDNQRNAMQAGDMVDSGRAAQV